MTESPTAQYRFRITTPDGLVKVSETFDVPPHRLTAVPAAAAKAALQAQHLPEAAVIQALADGTHEAILRTHFGEAYDGLADTVKSLAARAEGKKKRRVLILPGTMASLIGEPQGSENHVKWLDPLEVAAGTLFKLAWSASDLYGVAVASLLPCYLPLKLRLELADHDVDIVHYDWRHNLDDLGKWLAGVINADPAEKITLVCHSMGGLVARAALKADAKANAKVDLVVQMGTPNLGAPGLLQAMRGTYPLVMQVASLDLHHTPADYGKLVCGFPGMYALMPPSGPQFGVDLRDAKAWPKVGNQPVPDLLTSVGVKQDNLIKPDARFTLVAGINVETVMSVQVKDGDFLYQYGYAGDGTVPDSSSKIAGIAKVWYDEGTAHQNLCMEPSSCDAVAAILDGKAPALKSTYKLKKEGISKTETDASLLQSSKILKFEGDARHLYDTVHTTVAAAATQVQATAKTAEVKAQAAATTVKTAATTAVKSVASSLKKTTSWLKSHL